MPLLFSYGTLQQEDVQLSTFGRRLRGNHDVLPGYERSSITIDGASYFTLSPNVNDRVAGVVLEVTDAELAKADEYEGDFYYARVLVTLESGKKAWVYVRRAQPGSPARV